MVKLPTVLVAAAVTALLLAAPAPALAAGQPSLRTDWRERMLVQLNAVRAEAGSPPLRMCPALTRSAQSYAGQMMRDNRFSHTGADGSSTEQRITGSGYRGVVLGENLAAGQPTVAKAVRDWRGSSSHFAAMTDPRFRHVGFGYEPGRSARYATFWVQHFGTGGSCG